MATAAPPRVLTSDHFEAEDLRRRLGTFSESAWPLVEKRRYKSNWHIEVIAEHLEAVSRGELLRLIINIPPRHMKSLSVAVFWPCWDWLDHPERQWLFASYAEKLSKRDSLKCRRIIQSLGGRRHGGTLLEKLGYDGVVKLLGGSWELAPDQNEKLRFENTEGGYRLATSVDGTATGEGGDILVVDDPHKANEIESEAERENVIEFLDGTLSTRLNDPTTGAVVCVMQRLHEDDATGHMLERGGYHHLCLPAEYEPTHPFVCPAEVELPSGRVIDGDPRTEEGELLWPEHFTDEAVEELKLVLGSYRSAGQLQQRPAPAEGGILKRKWWRYYDPAWLEDGWSGPRVVRLWQSWDTALKEKTTSDFAVGTLWAQIAGSPADKYLLRLVRGQWGQTETETQIEQLAAWALARFPDLGAHEVRIEKAANGAEIIAAMRHRLAGIKPITADRDKVVRAEAITPQLEAGNVYVPGWPNAEGTGFDAARTPPWVQGLIEESASFPHGSHDDQVDSLTQALDPRHARRSERGASGGGYASGQATRNR